MHDCFLGNTNQNQPFKRATCAIQKIRIYLRGTTNKRYHDGDHHDDDDVAADAAIR